MMPYRFVHAADIHLDSPLRSLALRNAELAELIGNATRQAFTNLVELCLNEQVDALLLAGDLYDGEQTSMKTARFLAGQIKRLDEAGIQVFIIRGNHDALSRITKELTFPASVKVFGGRADFVAVERPGLAVAVHGLSFAQPKALDSLLQRYRTPLPGMVNIALMHTSLDGAPGHDVYAPCKAAELDDAGFDYWALGHIHKRSVLKGRCCVVMPGMPQGRDSGENGQKSVTLVTIADDRSITIEERLTSIAQFETVPVNLTGVEDWRDMLDQITADLQRMRETVASEHLVARLQLMGRTPLAWRIRGDRDLLWNEAVNHASGVGKTWIEKIEIACQVPGAGSATERDPVAELQRLIAEDVVPSAAYQTEVAAVAKDLRAQLPAECRHLLGTDEAGLIEVLNRLVAEGAEDVLGRLHAGSEAN
jgi:DNA repair exonuclease SbcCD nuclease subunit